MELSDQVAAHVLALHVWDAVNRGEGPVPTVARRAAEQAIRTMREQGYTLVASDES
jgi:hypothetical protein